MAIVFFAGVVGFLICKFLADGVLR
jgi:hypothetical protein